MELRAAYAFILGLFLAMVLIPPLVRIAGRVGLVDTGGGRKVHVGQIPRIGGVAIVLGSLLPVLIWAPLQGAYGAFMAAAAVLFGFGVIDDRFNLDYRLKLLGQTLAALIVTVGGDVLISSVPFLPGGLLPQPLALLLTVVVLVGVTNAVNLSDGLDGLAAGICLLAVGVLLLFAQRGGEASALIVLAAMAGAILGFLRFNTYPARLFMGDSGSQFLGFGTGVLAIMLTQGADVALSPVLPLLVLGLPILDTLTVMVRRIARGQSPFQADRTHLHHRLLAAGLTQVEAVSLVYTAQFVLVSMAYLLRDRADGLILLIYAAYCGLVLLGVQALERHHLHLRQRAPGQGRLARLGEWARHTRLLTRFPLQLLGVAVPMFLVLGALAVFPVDIDIGMLALALFVLLLPAVLIRPIPFFALERTSAYTAAAALVYLLARSPALTSGCELCLPVFYGTLAATAAVWVRFSSAAFRVSTLDVLILLGALVAPTLRGLGLEDLGILALECVVVFYCIEILMQERARDWDPLRVSVLTVLAILAYKGLWG